VGTTLSQLGVPGITFRIEAMPYSIPNWSIDLDVSELQRQLPLDVRRSVVAAGFELRRRFYLLA
jgi:hypothetical protein